MLELDYTNALADAVGAEHGVRSDDMGRLRQEAPALLDRVEQARRTGHLGFADLPFDDSALSAIEEFAASHAYPNILILGIGGSALGPAALESALSPQGAARRLVVLDNIDPDFVNDTLMQLEPKDCIVCVIAKSGVTAETMASFAVVRQWLISALGSREAKSRFVAVTDPEKGDLLQIARQEGMPVFFIPSHVGGRFSVLTPVGTLPAALLGLPVRGLFEGARAAALQAREPLDRNPALLAAGIQHTLDRRRGKNVLVLFPYSQALWRFAFWFKQLWGESLGKRLDRSGKEVGVGQTPTAALGVTDQHSQLQLFVEGPNDKAFMFFDVAQYRQDVPIDHPFKEFDSLAYLNGKSIAELFRAERRATEIALTEAARPNVTVRVDRVSAEAIGELIMFSEYQTAYGGELYDINAFDQPGVEYGKKLTFAMMGRSQFASYREKVETIEKRGRRIVR